MKRKLNELGSDEGFDYCIVGTGPAGISCAMILAKAGKKIALVEGGSDKYTADSQAFYQGTMTGDPYRGLTSSRLRFFGGTSNHWAGWCRTLDSYDFEKKTNTDTEWPITRDDLDPHLAEASGILDIPEIPPDVPFGSSGLKIFDFVWSPPYRHLNTYFPVRFHEKFLRIVVAHRNIHLFLDSNLIRFHTDGREVTGAEADSHTGGRATIRSRAYVLAAGGIENSRILLWSNELAKGALIKNADGLGRYWMEHPHFTLGYGFLASNMWDDVRSQRERLFLAPSESTIKSRRILNCGLRVDLLRSGQQEIIEDFAAVAPATGREVRDLFKQGRIRAIKLRAAWEQEPLASNRITLTRDVDRLGMPRVNIHWEKSELDRRTALVTAQLFGNYIANKNIGRLRLDPWILGDGAFPEDDELGGNHHLGGTRMAGSSDRGIVDRNCKVFGQRNLYVAGSSVFPGGGHANPTLTIVQLAVRLAKHLAVHA